MKKIISSLVVGMAVLCGSATVQARDTKLILPIRDALNYEGKKGSARELLDPGIALVFARGGGSVVRADVKAIKRTNGFGKSDADACHWAFLSAVRQLQEVAREAGATKVVNLISYYKDHEYRGTSEYECHAGAFIVGVTLRGDLAR